VDWHPGNTDAVLHDLRTNTSRGLTHSESMSRLAASGPNELQAAKPISPWKIYGEQVENILVIILLVVVYRLFLAIPSKLSPSR
jgi:magnesium-transporting ATPase (P-type)